MRNSARNGENVSVLFPLLSWHLMLLNHTCCNIIKTKQNKTTNQGHFSNYDTEIFLENNRITSYDLISVTNNLHMFKAVSTNSCMMGFPSQILGRGTIADLKRLKVQDFLKYQIPHMLPAIEKQEKSPSITSLILGLFLTGLYVRILEYM